MFVAVEGAGGGGEEGEGEGEGEDGGEGEGKGKGEGEGERGVQHHKEKLGHSFCGRFDCDIVQAHKPFSLDGDSLRCCSDIFCFCKLVQV